MSDEPLAREREPIERVRARLEALVKANAAPRCGARSKRTGKPCRAAAMPNGRCKVHGEYWAADAGGPRAEQAGKLETRLLLSRSEGGTVARAGGNTCAPLSAQLMTRAKDEVDLIVPRRFFTHQQRLAKAQLACRTTGCARKPWRPCHCHQCRSPVWSVSDRGGL